MAFLVLASGLASAQPTESRPAPPAPAPAADVQARFDAAFGAMTRGEFAQAASAFRAIAAEAQDPELRGAANQLGRLAEDLARRGARLAFGPPAGSPGEPAAPGGAPAAGPRGSEDDEPEGGRASFIVTTTLAALYTGVVLDDLVDVGDVRPGTLVVMGTTAAGLVGSLYGTRGRTMTGGMADAWSLGLAVGAGNALLLSGPFGLYDSTSNTSEKVQSFVLGASWGAATAGLLAADHYRPTRAQVSVMSTVGAMSIASTLLTLAMIQPGDLSGDSYLTITAVGLDAGLAAGAGFASTLDWSLSRARLVGLGALLGGLTGVGTSLLLFADSSGDNTARAAAGITLGGLWGGFLLGAYLTRDMAPDRRFAPHPGPTAQLAPTLVRDAPGLSVIGAF